MRHLIFIFLVGCAQNQPIQLTIEPEITHIQEKEVVYYKDQSCIEAIAIKRIRNNDLSGRMRECEAKGNHYLNCLGWIYGRSEDRSRKSH